MPLLILHHSRVWRPNYFPTQTRRGQNSCNQSQSRYDSGPGLPLTHWQRRCLWNTTSRDETFTAARGRQTRLTELCEVLEFSFSTHSTRIWVNMLMVVSIINLSMLYILYIINLLSSTALRCSFEVLVLYLTISIFCPFIRPFYFILEASVVSFNATTFIW